MDRLLEIIKQDEMFYEQSGGGVTLSGGEVLAQDIDYLTALIRRLFREGFSVNIDTCGYASFDNFIRILPFVDTFLYDIKLINPEKHQEFTGVDNSLILDNLIHLSEAGAKIAIRIPVINGVNATLQEMTDISHWLLNNRIHAEQINLIPYHNIGTGKYAKLDKAYAGVCFSSPAKEALEEFTQLFVRAGFSNVTHS
jgi:pyruvate formate lyase activating enzyme